LSLQSDHSTNQLCSPAGDIAFPGALCTARRSSPTKSICQSEYARIIMTSEVEEIQEDIKTTQNSVSPGEEVSNAPTMNH